MCTVLLPPGGYPDAVKKVYHIGIIFVNNQLDAQFFFMDVYFCSLDVSGRHVPIIRRIVSIHLVYVTLYRCIDTINSTDDGHMAARNM